MAKDLNDVIAQMAAQGIHLPHSVDLGRAFAAYLRFRPEGDKRNKKSAWVRLFEYRSPHLRDGIQRTYITGVFGNRGDQWDVASSGGDWSPAERAAELEARKAAARAADAERQKDASGAAEKAQRMWARAREFTPHTPPHPYLETKRVAAFGVRLGFNARLLVPLRDVQGALHGLQYIGAEGAKLFGTGTLKEGRSHLLGEVREGAPLAFGEGYATCASAHMATSWPVVTCFDAGNLGPVMAAWRKLYPDLAFVVLADDDRHLLARLSERLARHGIVCTAAELRDSLNRGVLEREWQIPDGAKLELRAGWKADAAGVMRIEGALNVDGVAHMLLLENAGQAKAHAAARKFKARVLTPFFADRESPATDWNDLHCGAGLESVREQLLTGIDAPPEKPRANDRAQRGKGKGAGAGGPDRQGGTGGAGHGEGVEGAIPFLQRFTLIYGTTTVWDAQEHRIIRLEALKVAYGKRVDWWLGQDDRLTVSEDHVVFDPSLEHRPPEWVNLFDRMPLGPPPPGASCARIVEHLVNICQDNDALAHWVTAWLALPLQRPGTKMRTALVLHGRTEGTGKSLLMDVMRRIYGRYSIPITQLQLQTEFTGWMSGKMFCVAEEVVSRQDRSHHKGLLQNLITNELVQINEKNMPLRTERNLANFVFLSNDQVPLLLNPRDRRYTVVRVEREHPQEYFETIAAEMDAGGVEAFQQYLLNYDLQGFNEFTRPFENRDRMHLISLGMAPDQRFMLYWTAGLAGVPFCCCPAADLYSAFKAWGRVNGERYVPTSTAFGRTVTEELERMKAPGKGKARYEAYSDKQVNDGDWDNDTTTRQGVLYFVPAELERMWAADDDGADVKPPRGDPDGAPIDVRRPEYFNAKIKLFQVQLHELLGSARRAL